MKKNIDFRANGKLLLTGEYLVLAGARALALPVKFGQTLHGSPTKIPWIRWRSCQPDGEWFSCELDPGNLKIRKASDSQIALHLVRLLKTARDFNPAFLTGSPGWEISVVANYPLKWGLGSSSSLISLVARWAEVDPFSLFRMVSAGSGYDIACATQKEMLFYRLHHDRPEIRPAFPGRALKQHTCFAYLGKKQETGEEVSAFLSSKNFTLNDLRRISELSIQICEAEDPSNLIGLVEEHEFMLSRILKRRPIAEQFGKFPGTVKSLGAWGGDFAMFVSDLFNEDIKDWLVMEGFSNEFTLDELKTP